jgi:splicing factor 3A subunit 3
MFNSAEELEALGLERLKEGLEALGLKCGGTLQDRALRLWSVRGKKPAEIPDKLKKKSKDSAASGSGVSSGEAKRREIALLEYNIQSLCDLIADIVTATRRHAEKQQTRTMEEKLAEILEEEHGTLPDIEENDEDDDADEGPLYNPLNLPLGWDGKPIPFWLYKLHGLGVEYKCEICGNQSYWGRRAFDRHFQEWRHAHGMRCLGVPNTKHFHDICLIEDALALHAKIKDGMQVEQFVGDTEEEFEDSEGNVLNRRTYEDLARQGLL